MRFTLVATLLNDEGGFNTEVVAQSNEQFDLIEWVLLNSLDYDSENVYAIYNTERKVLVCTLTRGRTPNHIIATWTKHDEPTKYYVYTNKDNSVAYQTAR